MQPIIRLRRFSLHQRWNIGRRGRSSSPGLSLHPLAPPGSKSRKHVRVPPPLTPSSLVGFFLSSCRDLYLADGSRISRVSRRPDYTLFLEEERTRSKHAVPTRRASDCCLQKQPPLCLGATLRSADNGISNEAKVFFLFFHRASQ